MGEIRTFVFGDSNLPQDKFQQQDLDNCAFVKTALMLVVVIYHSILFWRGSWISIEPILKADVFGEIAKWMNTYHVQTFTFTSGYIFYSLKYEYGKYSEFKPFLKNKAQRLLVPFVFISVVWCIPLSYFAGPDTDIISKYLLGEGPAQLWFLLMLFWVFVIFGLTADFFRKYDIIGTVVVLILYKVGLEFGESLPNIFQIFKACSFLVFFWMGFKMRQYPKIIIKRLPTWLWLILSIAVYILSILMPTNRFIFRKIKKFLPLAVNTTAVLSAFLVLQKIASKFKFDNKIFSVLKENSMQIYFFHQQVIYVCIHLLNGYVNPYIHAGINFLVSILVSVLISLLLHKFKTTRILIGEK